MVDLTWVTVRMFWRTTFYISCLQALLLAGPAKAENSTMLDPDVMTQKSFLVSEDYEGVWQRTLADDKIEMKVIKDGHWAIKRRSADGDTVVAFHGGSYVVPGDVFVETVDFVESGDANLVGKSFVYRVSVEDGILRQTAMGEGADTTEWTRVEIFAAPAPQKAFSMGSIAIINTEGGSGSGFVVEMDGRKYLVTNQHVLDCMDSIDIKTLENVRIRPVGFEISRKLDLVRLEITNDVPALAIKQELPAIGDTVKVYGNSAGGGVATEIEGKVLGVGPDLIEVDAEFVEGNSGCPMLNNDSEVIGVAAYATHYQDTENLLSKNTRFQEIRRFGIRLNTGDWTAVSPRLYQDQARELSDYENAVFMYAITYLSFRYYVNEPSRYKYRSTTSGNNGYTTERIERDKEIYEEEYARWQEFIERFNAVKPDQSRFFSDVLYRRCANHYGKASKVFIARGSGLNWKEINTLRDRTQSDSITNLKHYLSELEEKRYAASLLSDKQDTLIKVCEYLLELRES